MSYRYGNSAGHNVSTLHSTENDISTPSDVHRPFSFPAGDAQTGDTSSAFDPRAFAQPSTDTTAFGEQAYMQTGGTSSTFDPHA